MKDYSSISANDIFQQGKPVLSGTNSLAGFGEWIALQPQKFTAVVLCDENTAMHCLPQLKSWLPSDMEVRELVIPAGESSKSIEHCLSLYKKLTHLGIDKNDLLINLGGGVVCDIGGFVAATYLRGLRFVNMPTSLLAMADAGLGGKTGVDLDNLKNRIGLIAFPECTVCDPLFLDTLNDDEWKNGTAEVYKHALIADPELWSFLVNNGCGRSVFPGILKQVQRVKLDVISRDPFEKGVRRILNYGHTVGHAIESLSLAKDVSPLSHGDAVAAGMMIENEIAVRLSLMQSAEALRIREVLDGVGFHADIRNRESSEIISYMKFDKKNHAGNVRMSLLKGVGQCEWNIQVSDDLIRGVLSHFGAAI